MLYINRFIVFNLVIASLQIYIFSIPVVIFLKNVVKIHKRKICNILKHAVNIFAACL
jgi:hypothetical protein